ncbi:hypothetical protein ABZU76_38545 [Amycolatopsis sp. NPDC005232]|uniref:hypothetical protein n=1 Tax=Amycolatopsis sp. NPDC005232 TaxID=3157027 RepID=UPI0033A254B4
MKASKRAGVWGFFVVSSVLAVTGCRSSVVGQAHPATSPEAKQVETGIALQNLTTAPAKANTYAGQPVYDACAIMNPFLMQQAGFVINPEQTFQQMKFTGDDGPPAPGTVTYDPDASHESPEPASECLLAGKDIKYNLSLSIDQKQYESSDMSSERDTVWRLATNSEAQQSVQSHTVSHETRGDMQIYVTMGTLVYPDEYQVYFFWGGDQYWATLTMHASDYGTREDSPGITKEPADALKFLVDQVAGRLAAGPDKVGLSKYKYAAPWNMPTACDVYKPEDWALSFTNDSGSARVHEDSSIGPVRFTADPQDPGKGPWQYVWSSCYRMNHANTGNLVNQDGLTVQIDTYNNVDGAIYSNHVQCHPHANGPGGPPSPETKAKLGDGDVCWIPTGGNDHLLFKVGRHVVEMWAFKREDYQQPALNAVFGKVTNTIVDRLKKIP